MPHRRLLPGSRLKPAAVAVTSPVPCPVVRRRQRMRIRTGHPGSTGGDRSARGVVRPVRDAGSSERRTAAGVERRKVIAVVLVAFLAMLGAVGYGAMRFFGGAVSAPDYSGAIGVADVIVEIPPNSALSDFGNILTERDVVKSTQAFINAAGGRTMEGGYQAAHADLGPYRSVDDDRLDQGPSGGADERPRGVAARIEEGHRRQDHPGHLPDDRRRDRGRDQRRAHRGVTVKELQKVAATAKPSELGVPDWRKYVTASEVRGDFRRLEGLIAPGTGVHQSWSILWPPRSCPI